MCDKEQDEETRLQAITDEVEAVLRKHDVGGVVLIASNGCAAWAHSIPTDVDLYDTPIGLRVAIREPLDTGRAHQTMHVLGCLRDMANDCNSIYGRLYRMARNQLHDMGADEIERRISGGSGRVLEAVIRGN